MTEACDRAAPGLNALQAAPEAPDEPGLAPNHFESIPDTGLWHTKAKGDRLIIANNNDFRVTEMSYAGSTESYSYDRDGLLTSAGEFSITRNSENGLPESLSDGTYTKSRTFNGYGEMSHRETAVAGYDLYTSDITRNENGRITEKTVTLNGETHTYAYDYDKLGRLTQVTRDGSVVEEYAYAPDGTRISERNTLRGIDRSLSYDKEDRLLTAGKTQHQYSADGFLTQRPVVPTPPSTTIPPAGSSCMWTCRTAPASTTPTAPKAAGWPSPSTAP